MAKIVALILVAITLVAAQVPAECATAEKSISEEDSKMKKALDGVISSAPPAEKSETKVAGITAAYGMAADAIIATAPADEFTVMEESVPAECAIADKSICELDSKVRKALHGVVSAAPPAKKSETKDATFKQSFVAAASLAQAANAGDDKKVAAITAAYGRAADAVIAAAPADKFTVMEETFNAAASVATECAIADKSICEMYSKIQKALHGVISAAPPAKKSETIDATNKQTFAVAAFLAQAANAGDNKKVAKITAAYGVAADKVIAAAPADKFTVMEETFAAARPVA